MRNYAMLGKWHVHAEGYAREFNASGKAKVVAVWDEEPTRGRSWAEELGCPFFESLDELHLAKSEATPSKPSAEETAAKSAGKLSYEQQKERAKIIRKAERAVAEKEQLVTRLEQQKADIEALLATPENGNNADLFAQYADVQKQLATAEEEWMMAEEELAALSE